MFQHIHTYREERGTNTKLYAKVLKSKTNAENEGQSFLLFENDKGSVTWHGLNQFKENNLWSKTLNDIMSSVLRLWYIILCKS